MAVKEKVALALFDDPDHPLAAPLAAWGAASPRFATFLVEHRDKIRKKARGARDPEALGDLLLELAVARDLHRERHGTLGYELQLPGRTRVPDFALTLRNGSLVIVEVTRVRPAGGGAEGETDGEGAGEPPPRADEPPNLDARLAVLLCNKLSQLVPNLPNLIVVGVPPAWLPALDVEGALRGLLGRAERRELRPRERHPFKTPGDFFRFFRNLSALHIRPWPPASPAPPATVWVNRQATKPLPPKLWASLVALPDEEGES